MLLYLFHYIRETFIRIFRSISSIFPSCILGYYLKLVTSPQLDLISLHMPIVVVKVILLIHVGDELSAMVRVLDFSSLDCASLSEFRAAWYHSAIFYQQNFLKRQMCYKVAQDSQF